MEIFNSITGFVIALLSLSGLTGGVVAYILHRSAEKRIKEAEAREREATAKLAEANVEKARWERYEKQLDHAMQTIEKLQKMVEDYATELSDKTARIRELTDKLLLTQGMLNNANHKILRITEERDRYRLLYEVHKEYLCTSETCCKGKPDPKGRRPPNPRILGKKFPISTVESLAVAPDEDIIPTVKPSRRKKAEAEIETEKE